MRAKKQVANKKTGIKNKGHPDSLMGQQNRAPWLLGVNDLPLKKGVDDL